MKKTALLAAAFGMAFILAGPAKSEAFCLFGCSDVAVETEVDVETNVAENNDDSAVAQGTGNVAVNDIENSIVIGDSVNTRQSNFVGAIGSNRGDLSQSNSANITGNQNTNIHDNDMRTIRGFGNNN